jgi:KDO2-lipid IV(A) lauroyltransferase
MSETIHHYISRLPISWGGRFLYYCVPFRRQVMLANMRQVFANQLTSAEYKRLALAAYSHVFRCLAENVMMRFKSLAELKDEAVVVGHEHVLKAAEQGKGVLLLTGHFGNWELAPIAGILNFREYQHRFHFVRKTLGWQWLERQLFKRYFAAGLGVIPKKNSLDKVCAALERNDAVVFILDQHASIAAKDGIAVNFFGKKAGTFKSLAMLAQYSKAPVLPCTSYRREDGKHVLAFFPPLAWLEDSDPKQAMLRNTEGYNQALEQLVLAHPEQWMWFHRRWKLRD